MLILLESRFYEPRFQIPGHHITKIMFDKDTLLSDSTQKILSHFYITQNFN